MKILLISDTHNKHSRIPHKFIDNNDNEIDMIIHAGDVSSRGSEAEILDFLKWYESLNFKYKILIAGNHDFFFERASKYILDAILVKFPSIIYLNDASIEIEGFKIWGSPVQPVFHNWAFNRNEKDIQKHWGLIPENIDVLVVHGGPKHIGMLSTTYHGEDIGCPYLYDRIEVLKNLKLFIHGHCHEGYGTYEFLNRQLFVNASVLNHRYEMVNNPILVEYNKETKLFKQIEN